MAGPARREGLPPAAIWILVVILASGLTVRLAGSAPLHVDEPYVVFAAAHLVKDRTLDPGVYNHPNHFLIYLSALSYPLMSWWKFAAPFDTTFDPRNAGAYYYASRLINGAVSALVIVLALLIGLRVGTGTGLVAAALFAVFAPYVDDAHLARPDNGLVLFTLATVWAALRYQEQPTTGALVLAAACAALSVSVKYPGVANGLVVALAVLIVHHRSPRVVLWRLAGAAAVFVAVLFAAAPYVLLRMPVVLRVFAQEIRPHARAPALGFWGNLAFYVGDFMTEAGLVLSVFAIYGGYRVLREAGPRATPLFIGLVYWVGLSLPSVHWSRWGLPMYATPLLLAAVGMSSAGAAIDAMPRGRSRTAWFAALAMLLAIGVVAPLTESLVRVSAPYDHADPYNPPAPVLRAGSTGR